jgi:integrin alpha FG-GAP repeat containing protein 1
VDGYPDLLLTVVDPKAKTFSGILGSQEGSQARILRNVACGRGLPGCDAGGQERTFSVGQGKGWEAMEEIWDVTGASWIDIDDDVGDRTHCLSM